MAMTDAVLTRVVDRQPRFVSLWRYGVTSVLATAVSEATLLAVYGTGLLHASGAAAVASLAGTLPSYLMSRHWIWPDAERRRPGRQIIAYWLISIVCLLMASAATGWAAGHAPAGRVAHLVFVGVAYLGILGVLWLAKFAIYQTVLFRPRPRVTEPAVAWARGSASPETGDWPGAR
jgi:putative flippase GtrA